MNPEVSRTATKEDCIQIPLALDFRDGNKQQAVSVVCKMAEWRSLLYHGYKLNMLSHQMAEPKIEIRCKREVHFRIFSIFSIQGVEVQAYCPSIYLEDVLKS